ncbi:MAG TPA: hypothetical protein VH575_33705 [Gemmataceae bacterium]|jgi:hypothetical protein
MTTDLYRYQFAENVPPEEIEATILLSLFAVESLHGESQTRLDAAHHFDTARCACVIDAATAVGRDFNRLFVGFLRREFGEDAFQVERLRGQPATESAAS